MSAIKQVVEPYLVTFRRALKIVKGNPKSNKIKPTAEFRFEVIDLECVWCSGVIFAEPFTISKEDPNGWLWYCDACGEVDEDGHPWNVRDQDGKLVYGEEEDPPTETKSDCRQCNSDEVPF